MSYDITLCVEECSNYSCERNQVNAKEAMLNKGFASFANYRAGCKEYTPLDGKTICGADDCEGCIMKNSGIRACIAMKNQKINVSGKKETRFYAEGRKEEVTL